ncbi:uncharacterized protein BJ212DRAFT_1275505 [Suillus subaureus]|uniref:Uncharacterized protein n=1 Tax=Suillus subaureus TaxID=48587 RepID=A0A9P7JBT9_9AGAM|nr:uncharacterized protein BJ212DRAFT_1275505 [Suillus subaureus]KAG1813235.1 hypothetical protein BJ212DRAFT_1275505 [Suillus subaureus]
MLTASFRPPSGGWYSRPPPQMQRRGRSRQISPVALARQASEERRLLLYVEKQREAEIAIHTNVFGPPRAPSLPQSEKADPSLTHPQEQGCGSDASSPVCSPSHSTNSKADSMKSADRSPSSTRSLSPTPSGSLGSAESSAPSSISLDSYDSPPSPPRSLEDQVQVAYALDDIRLAKILLLKLKGIDVTSDNDPRIDEVRDEDFDMCFVPSGPLKLEEPELLVVQETRRRQQQKWEEAQRRQRLRGCERVWEEEKHRLHTERLRAIRRREEDIAVEEERRRIAEVHKRQEAELALRQRSTRVGFSMVQRQTVSYGKLSQARLERCSSKRDEDLFQYSFMRPMNLSTTPPKRGFTSPKPLRNDTTSKPPGGQQRTVSFKEVMSSMDGKLFPLDAAERAEEARRIAGISTVTSPSRHRHHNSARSDLLLSLLHVVEWQEGERRKAKGKDVERPAQFLEQSPLCSTPTPVLLIPSTDSIPPMSSSVATSRSNSWLSFGSWRSSVTGITSPEASSPVIDSPKCSMSSLQLPTFYDSQRDINPRSSFVRVSLDETPLSPPKAQRRAREVQTSRPPVDVPSLAGQSRGLESMGKSLVRHVSRSVHGIVDVARGLQSAYVSTTMFSVGAAPSHSSMSSSQSRAGSSSRRSFRPYGYRARPGDVKKFTSLTTPSPTNTSPEPIHFIPLVSPFPPSATLVVHHSAVTHSPIIPSPLRPRTPPTALAYRMRPVANPEILRLRALQNLMYLRGKEWEGRGREGGLGCGKERLLGVAFEGRGPSGLGCEIRFVIA